MSMPTAIRLTIEKAQSRRKNAFLVERLAAPIGMQPATTVRFLILPAAALLPGHLSRQWLFFFTRTPQNFRVQDFVPQN